MGPLMNFTANNALAKKTPPSMSLQNGSQQPLYATAANGIVPGYQGHVPGGRDAYGTSHMGGLSYDKWVTEHAGPAARREKPQEVESVSSPNIKYRQSVNGVMPGYGGTRIGSSEEYGRSAFGGVPQYIDPNGAKLGQGNRELPKAYDSDFRKEVGGVVPGYTGFVPDKHSKYGESHWGQVSGTSQGKAAARDKGDKKVEVTARVKPGYSGHVPGARDSFGSSTATTYDF